VPVPDSAMTFQNSNFGLTFMDNARTGSREQCQIEVDVEQNSASLPVTVARADQPMMTNLGISIFAQLEIVVGYPHSDPNISHNVLCPDTFTDKTVRYSGIEPTLAARCGPFHYHSISSLFSSILSFTWRVTSDRFDAEND
jgi:hypothetical protein